MLRTAQSFAVSLARLEMVALAIYKRRLALALFEEMFVYANCGLYL